MHQGHPAAATSAPTSLTFQRGTGELRISAGQTPEHIRVCLFGPRVKNGPLTDSPMWAFASGGTDSCRLGDDGSLWVGRTSFDLSADEAVEVKALLQAVQS